MAYQGTVQEFEGGTAVEATLTLVKDLVTYAVLHINIHHMPTALNVNVHLKVLFTGLHVNCKKDLSLAFGNYTEV
jgi:hypothetical protein